MWGEQATEDQVDFSWPPSDQIIAPDVRLHSIELRTHAPPYLSWVQCTLSNGLKSPIFEQSYTSSGQYRHPQTLNIDENTLAKV